TAPHPSDTWGYRVVRRAADRRGPGSRRRHARMRTMTTRRAVRPSQVRPRPPSTGRPAPERTRPRTTPPVIPSRHRPIEHRRGLPLPARILLALSVILLGGVILYASTGQLGKLVAGFGASM